MNIMVADHVSTEDKQLFKKVSKMPIQKVLGSKFSPPAGKTHAVVDEFNNILNFCAEDYQLVENSKILLPVENKLAASKVDFVRSVEIYNGSQFYVKYYLKNKKKKVLGELYPKLTIVNSYDGKVKFRKEFGWMRLVCLNGLTRPDGVSNIQISKHNGDMDEFAIALLIDEIIQDTGTFIKESQKDIERFERLNKINANTKLIEKVTKALKLSDKITSAATDRFKLEVGDTQEPLTFVDLNGNLQTSQPADRSMFTLYNAINYAIYNLNPKEAPEKKAEKDSKLLSYVENLN